MTQDPAMVPPALPDTAFSPPVLAERIALRRLFDAALDVVATVEVFSRREPQALPVLTEWGHEHGRCIVRHDYPASDDCDAFSSHILTLGNGSRIVVYLR